MNLTSSQKSLVERVVNVFETGKPDGDYGLIAIFHDGPHNIRQITYGRSQTTEYGKLRQLVQAYVAANGIFSQALSRYADDVGSRPLTDNTDFKNLLRRAGREDGVMQHVQDQFFDDAYFHPAMAWADQQKFMLPLSALVIYDSFIHSGSILWTIRQMFPENPPSLGGNEKSWTTAYVNARHKWLGSHHREVVRRTVYRTACFKQQIQKGNWDISQVPIVANGVKVTPKV